MPASFILVLDHVKNKVKPQNKRFSYVRDWDGKVGRLVDLNVQMICLETDTIYHSYDEICAAIWSDGYGETRKEIVQKVGDAIRHGCPAFDMVTWGLSMMITHISDSAILPMTSDDFFSRITRALSLMQHG